MRKFTKVLRALILTAVFLMLVPAAVQAKGTPKLSESKISVLIGESEKITLKNAGGSAKWSLSKKGIVTLSKKSRKGVTVKAKKAGKVTLKVKTAGKTLKCTIKVEAEVKVGAGTFAGSQTTREAVVIKDAKKSKGTKDEKKHSPRVYTYTGIDRVDYLAEYYLARAGVKPSMSDDQIVMRIYNFLTKKWRYPYEQKGNKNKPIDVEAIADKIAAYKVKTDALYEAGKIDYDWSYAAYDIGAMFGENEHVYIDFMTEHMAPLIGVCDYNSAAFTIMCNHAGLVSGKAGGSVNGAGHAWSWVVVNGQRYYYDIGDAIHDYYKQKKIVYLWYKMTKKQMKKLIYVFSWID